MKKLYLVTGATGHLGTVLISELIKRGENIRALVRAGKEGQVQSGVEICLGDIRDKESLKSFFNLKGYDTVTLFHCAAIIDITSGNNSAVWDTNVNGTKNIMEWALNTGVNRVVYVSSVHAIPELPKPETIKEVNSFSPDDVYGQYAKSKAAAAQIVLDYAKKGLNVSIVHPSGIIGPGDVKLSNHMIRTLKDMEVGKIRIAISGGYDFVDSRDVVEGILACETKGKPGECYILNGHYVSVSKLLNMVRKLSGKKPIRNIIPYGLVKWIAPVVEKVSILLGDKQPLFTQYSLYTLQTNANFSHRKAENELGYVPRSIKESLRDSL